jgi:hypothetical protein
MVANAIADQDAAGNIKPSKSKSREKIDGVAAWCDALYAETDIGLGDGRFRSNYEDEGLTFAVGAGR